MLHPVTLALRKLRQEGRRRKPRANLSHISSKPGLHRDPPVPTPHGPVAGKCTRVGLAGACWEHLASTCNRHRVAHGMGCLVGHLPWLSFSSKKESAKLRGRASSDRPDPLDTPCHAYAPRASPGLGPQLF